MRSSARRISMAFAGFTEFTVFVVFVVFVDFMAVAFLV